MCVRSHISDLQITCMWLFLRCLTLHVCVYVYRLHIHTIHTQLRVGSPDAFLASLSFVPPVLERAVKSTAAYHSALLGVAASSICSPRNNHPSNLLKMCISSRDFPASHSRNVKSKLPRPTSGPVYLWPCFSSHHVLEHFSLSPPGACWTEHLPESCPAGFSAGESAA